MIGSRQRKDRAEISRKEQYEYSKHKNTLRMGTSNYVLSVNVWGCTTQLVGLSSRPCTAQSSTTHPVVYSMNNSLQALESI